VAGRVAAIAVGAIAVVWGIGAMIANRGEPATRPVDRTDAAASVAPKPSPSASTALDAAYATVDDMIGALRAGNYVLATVDARSLLEQRDAARAAGFALTGLDAELMARLVGLAGDVPPRVAAQLEDILGELYPAEPAPADRPGGGTGVILGPGTSNDATPTTVGTPSATTARGSTGAAHTGNGGNQGGGGNGGGSGGENHPGGAGGDPGGGGSGEGDGGGGTPPPEDEGDGGVTTPDDGAVGPGDGRAWGQSHRPDGGWHGEHNDERTAPGKPPWAGGPPSS
jgi:hypothetical protein